MKSFLMNIIFVELFTPENQVIILKTDCLSKMLCEAVSFTWLAIALFFVFFYI